MASEDSTGSIQFLVQFAAETWKAVRQVCGPKFGLAEQDANLWAILKRILEIANKPGSSLSRLETRSGEDCAMLCIACSKVLRDLNDILHAYYALGEQEQKVVDFGLEFASFSDRQEEVLGYFRSRHINLAQRFAHLLVTVSGISHPNATGKALEFAVNLATSKLMATSEFQFALLAQNDDNQEELWRKVTLLLFAEGFRPVFLVRHKDTIIAYVKAIEVSSAFIAFPTGPTQAAYNTLLNAEANNSDDQSDKHDSSRIYDIGEQNISPDGDVGNCQNGASLGEQTQNKGEPSTGSAPESATEPLSSSSGYDQGTTVPESVSKLAVDDQVLAQQLEEKASPSAES